MDPDPQTWLNPDPIQISSVADPCHFGVDPDPRIHASD
jgi:hypothetical protein